MYDIRESIDMFADRLLYNQFKGYIGTHKDKGKKGDMGSSLDTSERVLGLDKYDFMFDQGNRCGYDEYRSKNKIKNKNGSDMKVDLRFKNVNLEDSDGYIDNTRKIREGQEYDDKTRINLDSKHNMYKNTNNQFHRLNADGNDNGNFNQ